MGSFASSVALTPIQLSPLSAVSVATLVTPDATNGNKFVVKPGTILRVKNASGSQITVTIHQVYTRNGASLPNLTFTVPLTTGDVEYKFPEVVKDFFYSGKTAWVEFSAVTSVTCQVVYPN
jgi:hypothetical protein